MANRTHSKDKAFKVFRAKTVMTLPELALELQRSQRTAQRQLHQWNVYTSYNKNGRYYVLPDVPQFDSNGLWRYRGIFFSRHGNLTQTLVAVVKHSKAGLNAAELTELLGLSPRSFLSAFRSHPELRREKHQGCFVYFSSEPSLYEQQKNQRLAMIRNAKQPSEVEAIAILVEAVKHPELTHDQLCAQLKSRHPNMTPEAVTNLFAQHGLCVKKTPHGPS